jgi:hypothetical protein
LAGAPDRGAHRLLAKGVRDVTGFFKKVGEDIEKTLEDIEPTNEPQGITDDQAEEFHEEFHEPEQAVVQETEQVHD